MEWALHPPRNIFLSPRNRFAEIRSAGIGKNLAALSHTLFRSPGAKATWGTGAHWARDAIGIGNSASPGIWRMMVNRARGKKYGAGAWIGKGYLAAFTAYAAIEGYQEGGVSGAIWGAGKAVAEMSVMGAIWGGAKHALTSPMGMPSPTTAAVIGLAGAYGIYKGNQALNKASIARLKRARRLEFGGPTLDVFGNMATMRMRSLQALQRSSLNGRYSLGNEAQIFH